MLPKDLPLFSKTHSEPRSEHKAKTVVPTSLDIMTKIQLHKSEEFLCPIILLNFLMLQHGGHWVKRNIRVKTVNTGR